MKIWEEIKKQIKLETKWYFEPKEIDTDPLVDTLKKIFNTPIDSKYSLGGLATTYTNALFKVIDEDSSKKDRIANFEVLKNVEPFLKKILYFKDFEKFLIIKDEMKGLTPILKSCGLNPSNIYMDEEHLKSFTEDQYEYHLTKTFILRNLESHNCELWSSRELEENIGTELIFYMEAVNRCHDAIALKLSEVKTDYTTYIENEITEFEKWASRFVATDTIEDFSVFESYAVEHIISYDESEEDNDDEIVKERSGTVDWIRKNNLPERRMILWGDAGLGKSTTLQYLTYLDARAYRKGISNIIPVYIPLGMLIDRYETLESYIFSRLKTEVEEGKKLLESGKINLFLDGVNEIPEDKSSDILSKRIKEIQLLIDSYPKTLMIISNRPEKYNQFRNIPVFRLQPMDYVKIMEFIQKNTRSEEVRNLIKEKIESNKRLLNIISTPLMTTRLISIVQEFRKVPESEGMIIKQFLDALYKRERVDKQDAKFDDDKINYLLTSLAVYGFKKNGTNSGLTRYEVLKCFSNCLEEFHFEYDTIYALEILIKMGVFNCDSSGEVIVFSHQAYQDYYLSRADTFSLISKEDLKKKDNELQEKQIKKEEIKQLDNTFIDEKRIKEIIKKNDNGKYDNYLMYKYHCLNSKDRNNELKKLASLDLALTTKIIVNDENSEEIEDFIINIAKTKYIINAQKGQRVLENHVKCIKTILLLNKIEEFNFYDNDLINSNELIITLASQLNVNSLILLLKKILFIDTQQYKNKKKSIVNICKQINKNSLIIDWEKKDEVFLYKLVEFIKSDIEIQDFQIFLYLSIPYKFIPHEVIDLIIDNNQINDINDCSIFIIKYGNQKDKDKYIKKIVNHNYYNLEWYKCIKVLFDILYMKDASYLKSLISNNAKLRAYIFTLLDDHTAIEVATEIGTYFYPKTLENSQSKPIMFDSTSKIFEYLGLVDKKRFIFFENIFLKNNQEIDSYEFETKEELLSFLDYLVFKDFPIYIEKETKKTDFSILYNKYENKYLRNILDRSMEKIILFDNQRFYFSVFIDKKEYVAKCKKSNFSSQKNWTMFSLKPLDAPTMKEISQYYSENLKEVINLLNDSDFLYFEVISRLANTDSLFSVIKEGDLSYSKVVNNINLLSKKLPFLDFPELLFLMGLNKPIVYLFVYCKLGLKERYLISWNSKLLISPKKGFMVRNFSEVESEYVKEKFFKKNCFSKELLKSLKEYSEYFNFLEIDKNENISSFKDKFYRYEMDFNSKFAYKKRDSHKLDFLKK